MLHIRDGMIADSTEFKALAGTQGGMLRDEKKEGC